MSMVVRKALTSIVALLKCVCDGSRLSLTAGLSG